MREFSPKVMLDFDVAQEIRLQSQRTGKSFDRVCETWLTERAEKERMDNKYPENDD